MTSTSTTQQENKSVGLDLSSQKTYRNKSIKPPLTKTACIILAGGQGSRLFPLTKFRCKPAIVFGGRYKLIDIPLSNTIHCGISKIFIATQFLSRSLHRHISYTYRKDALSHGFIEVLSAEQRPDSCEWYRGTADAVRQNMEYLLETDAEYFLILSGDQLYRLDFADMLQTLIAKDVDVLVATLGVTEKDAPRLGIMKINEDHHIVDFCEKPSQTKQLERFATPSTILSKMGIPAYEEKQYLASMGIYLFTRKALKELIKEDPRDDFGKHLIPTQVRKGKVAAYVHSGYWEDIGTIDSFYQANMALTTHEPEFDCYTDETPILAQHHYLPGPRFGNTMVRSSSICEGSIIDADEVSNSIIGPRTVIHKGSIIRNSYLLGNDTYSLSQHELSLQVRPNVSLSTPPQERFMIGENCLIKKAIIDKNVCIGNRVQLINKMNLTTFDSDMIYIRDGIFVVPQGAYIPDDFVL